MTKYKVEWAVPCPEGRDPKEEEYEKFLSHWNPEHDIKLLLEELAKNYYEDDGHEVTWPVTFALKYRGVVLGFFPVAIDYEPTFTPYGDLHKGECIARQAKEGVKG